uniref:Zgc:77056 n=1 Tax=Scophthalmus maximus TaxID=52904 RepID=A0A8D3AQN6_SCOMX
FAKGNSGVSWVKPTEPSFLKKFKSDVGFKEGPTVDTKRLEMPALDDDSGSDREDELPQVVVLKGGDLDAEEVKKIKAGKQTGDDGAPPDGKILFKKPAKRSSSDKFQGITASSSKKKKRDGGEAEEKKEESSRKKVKNNSLLSFGGDEDE